MTYQSLYYELMKDFDLVNTSVSALSLRADTENGLCLRILTWNQNWRRLVERV